jgi:hypothetical protein
MSMPPVVKWRYDWKPEPGAPEKLYTGFPQARARRPSGPGRGARAAPGAAPRCAAAAFLQRLERRQRGIEAARIDVQLGLGHQSRGMRPRCRARRRARATPPRAARRAGNAPRAPPPAPRAPAPRRVMGQRGVLQGVAVAAFEKLLHRLAQRPTGASRAACARGRRAPPGRRRYGRPGAARHGRAGSRRPPAPRTGSATARCRQGGRTTST